MDGVTWQDYEAELESNLQDLHARVHRGAYRALPSRRKYHLKPDGRQRPLGIAALEDKLLQRAVVAVLNPVYEEEFLGFSYGFRPKRSQHDALDALLVGIERKKVNWILDLDVRDFFGTVSHEWVIRFMEHRIGDERILRLIRKWLKAGVLEEGVVRPSEAGTPQGATISPLLANAYLHYVFDLWAQQWRKRHATGDMIIVRTADDSVVGFEHHAEDTRFLEDLRNKCRWVRILVITAGSTIAAMIFRRPPQRGQCSTSISNTRLSRHAQLMRAGASGGGVWAWGIASLMGVDRLAGNDLGP